jgi:aspartate 1-decarboxylase
MQLTMLKAKIHRATVTDADLNYQGSITIDPALLDASGILPHEKVEIYNCSNGARFATYVIVGGPGEVCVNGAAARLVQRGDVVIIAAYVQLDDNEARRHRPRVIFVDQRNRIAEATSD